MNAERAATLIVEINPKEWPTAASINMRGETLSYNDARHRIEKDKTSYVFNTLPAGIVTMVVQTAGESQGNRLVGIETRTQEQILLSAGKEMNYRIASPD